MKQWVGWVAVAVMCVAVVGCKKKEKGHHHYRPDHRGGMTHDFSDVKKFAKRFESAKRTKWQKPDEVIKLLDLKPGMQVADIGAGTGYFLPYLAKALDGKGKVQGLDINEHMVKYMQKRIKKAGWKHVVARKIAGDDPQIKAGSTDRIIIVNTWHHIPKRVAYSKKLAAALSEQGAVYIIDFTKGAPIGPGKKHRVTPEQVAKELKAAGLKATVMKESLPHQYVVKGSKS